MARYVDIDKRYTVFIDETHGNVMTLDEILRALPPTEPDVVKVVRCKDCKNGRPYKHTKEYVSCEVDCEPIDRDSDFFCADGKRRE